VAVYRQRTTAIDDVLLRVVFPWLVSVRVTSILCLARIWSEPVAFGAAAAGPPNLFAQLWSKMTAWSYTSSIDGTFHSAKRARSRVS
jgi:hypothetical protein